MKWYTKFFLVLTAFIAINALMYSVMNLFVLSVVSLGSAFNLLTADLYIGSMLESYLSGLNAFILAGLSLPLLSKNVRLYGTKFLEKVTKNW